MNKWILATGMMLLVSLGTMAQERRGERPSAEDRAKRNTERMAEELSLTDAQKDQILAINMEYAKKYEAEMAKRRAEAEAKRAEMNAMRTELKEQDAKIEAVLTEEQRAKWTEIKAERMGDRRRGRPNAQIERDPRKGGN